MTLKAFSRLDLISQEYERISSPTLFERVLCRLQRTREVQITINLPVELYLRGEILCEDIMELGELERFTISDLMNILFDDFLKVIKFEHNLQDLHKRLASRTPITINVNEYLDETDIEESSSTDVVHTHIRLARKDALRGEVLLCDLEKVFPLHGFTLESVLQVILTDFLNEYQRGNHSKTIIKDILSKY